MTPEKFTQVRALQWPNGPERAAGHVAMSPGAIAIRSGLSFEAQRDDLDELLLAGLRMASGRQILLVSRPDPDFESYGLDVYVDPLDDGIAAMRELSEALGLQTGDVKVFRPTSSQGSALPDSSF